MNILNMDNLENRIIWKDSAKFEKIDNFDIKIGKTATIKGDIYFKDNLKIDEGADVDGYIKRVKQNNQSSSAQVKKDTRKPAEKNQDQQIDIEENDKKAVNQN